MHFKLFKKLVITIGLVIIISLSAIVMILSFVVSNYFSDEKYVQLSQNCDSVAEVVMNDINSAEFKRNIFNVIAVQNEVSGVDTFICDNYGRIIVCGCNKFMLGENCAHAGKTMSPNILKSALDEYFAVDDLNHLYKKSHYTVGKAIISADGTILGYVFSSTSAQSLRNLINKMYEMYFVSAIIPLIVMLIILYAMTYRYTRPLKSMSEAARAMSKGDFSKKIPVMSNDEIGELSVAFNNMTDSLARLEKMRRSFIADVSHELRTPMTTISGFIDGIIDGTIDEAQQPHYLGIVSSEVKRLSRVVESMLNLSKLDSGEITLNLIMFNITDTLVDIVVSREKQIEEKNISITGLDNLEKTFVYGDYDLLYQALYNLVDNAVKFADFGGEISFSVKSAAKSTQIIIKNTGEGIPEDKLNNIFDRFYKVDKSRSANKNSTGLGLYIVKTIIGIHSGTITAQSKEGEYTQFTVTLPNK